MNMGTRFIATKDAPVHQNVKEAIVNASELDTRLIMRSLTNTERVLNNPAVESLMAKEKALGDELTFEDIVDEVAGVYPKVMMEGEPEAGAWSCGMVAGLVNDTPTEEELEKANKQLNEILKDLSLGLMAIIPLAPITIPMIAKFAKKHNIDLLPEWFKESLK